MAEAPARPFPIVPRVGIVGAGQLARMTYQAGISLGLTVRLLAEQPDESAARIGADVTLGAATDAAALAAFAAGCDVVTFDHELVNAAALAELEAAGHRIFPTSETVKLAQNKRRQREVLGRLGFPAPANQVAGSREEIDAFARQHGWPLIAKAARGGYDGRGVWLLDDLPSAVALLEQTAAAGIELLLEERVKIEKELAVLVARRPGGEMVVYPVVQSVQKYGICHEILAPAPVDPEVAAQARAIGTGVAEAIGLVGVLAVELFLTGGRVLINELAARPHNSGHFSIEGCYTSQFENHLRAVLDWPLGSPELVTPAAAMVNVLAESTADPRAALPEALAIPSVRVHLYDKPARPGRKVGHVTAIGGNLAEVRARAARAAQILAGVPEAETLERAAVEAS